MDAATSVDGFLSNMHDRLLLRTGLRGVACYTGSVDHLAIGKEAIVFAVDPVAVKFQYRTLPKKEVWETYVVEGRTWVVKKGKDEPAIQAARKRALELFAEVVLEVVTDNTATATVNATANCQATLGVSEAHVASYSLQQYVIDGGRDCRITFKIEVEAKFTPA